MSENDFIIVDEEETNKEDNRQDTGREEEKKEVTTSDHSEKDDDGYERICFICHRPESVTGKMVELPNNIAVCPDCMQRSFDMMNNSSMDLSKMMNIPGVQFLNLSDLDNLQPKAQKIKQKKKKPKEFKQLDIKNIPAPHKIKARLDEYIVGQEYAKKAISVAVYNHYKRVMSGKELGVELGKSNILMLGPTGCGKTLLAQTLAKILGVPFAIADATALTEAGYVGEDVENILLKIIQAADGDIERAEYGIIYIDEIDKITRKSENPSITRDVSGEGVQQALLKIIEGTVASVPPQGGRKHPHQELIQIDTTNILFICGGAFEGIDKIIETRIDRKSIGFNAEIASKHEYDMDVLLQEALPQDLVKFGLIPELVGRLPVTVSLDLLDKDALIRILTEPKSAIVKQYQKLLELDGVKLEFDKDALLEIAETTLKRKTGARGLRAIMENIMMDTMFTVPSDKTIKECRITKEAVLGVEEPKYTRDSEDRKSFLTSESK